MDDRKKKFEHYVEEKELRKMMNTMAQGGSSNDLIRIIMHLFEPNMKINSLDEGLSGLVKSVHMN